MSVAGFYISPYGTTIITDGVTYSNGPEGKLHTTDSPKVFKLSPSVALCWMGTRTTNIYEIVASLEGRTDPEGIISDLYDLLYKGLTASALEEMGESSINISTYSYEDGRPVQYQLNIWHGEFTRGQTKLSVGKNGCIMINNDKPEWGRHLNEAGNEIFKNGPELEGVELAEKIVHQAFKNLLEENKDNPKVGGEIFMETITNPIYHTNLTNT